MKIRGHESDAWHKGLDTIVGLQKPTDPDFPWTALQNHTGYYLKKKKKLSQNQVEERLTKLIKGHSSKEVAIAACGHLISAGIVRDLVIADPEAPSSGISRSCDFFECVISAAHVRPEAFNPIEVARVRYLREHVSGSSALPLSHQLRHGLALLSTQHGSGLLLQREVEALAVNMAKDFSTQIQYLHCENQWMGALKATRWLCEPSSNVIFDELEPRVQEVVGNYKRSWGSWTKWKPDPTRCLSWTVLAARAPSHQQDLFTLIGPDFASDYGREQDTLQDGLLNQGLAASECRVAWSQYTILFSRNPFEGQKSIESILQRLVDIIDHSHGTDESFRSLFTRVFTEKCINHKSLVILEGAQQLNRPAFTNLIIQNLFSFGQRERCITEEFKELLTIFTTSGSPCLFELREILKPHFVTHISVHLKGLRDELQKTASSGSDWTETALEALALIRELKDKTWLSAAMNSPLGHWADLAPSKETIVTLGSIRKSLPGIVNDQSLLRSQIDVFGRCLFQEDFESLEKRYVLIAALVLLWQCIEDGESRELAIIISNSPSVTLQAKCRCLRDISNDQVYWKSAILRALKSSECPYKETLETIKSLATTSPLHWIAWRWVLLFVIQQWHEELLAMMLETLDVPTWIEVVGLLQFIYRRSNVTERHEGPKIMSVELYNWSQKLVPYACRLERLNVLKGTTALRTILLGSDCAGNDHLICILELICEEKSTNHTQLMNLNLKLLKESNIEDVARVLLCSSKATIKMVQKCYDLIREVDAVIAEVELAKFLQSDDLSEDDRNALTDVTKLHGISVDNQGRPSAAGLEMIANSFHKRYVSLITEAQYLENLRLSLKASEPEEVSTLLRKLNIEEISALDDEIALLPPSISSEIERISHEEIELRFPVTSLSKMQRFAIGAGDAENFLIRLHLDPNGSPTKFCVHLSSDIGDRQNTSSTDEHSPWDITEDFEAPNEMHCFGRPNRGCLQLSLMLFKYLRLNFESVGHTYNNIKSMLSQFGSDCLMCGVGHQRLIRATPCSRLLCQARFSEVSMQILLADIWQDSPVVDLLVSGTVATASTGKLESLSNPPHDMSPLSIFNMLNDLPNIRKLTTTLQQSLKRYDENFRLPRALNRFCNNFRDPENLALGLLQICHSYGGFLVSARGSYRIPSFGSDQFLLANASPALEAAFSKNMSTSNSVSHILFHGTSLDRLYPILMQGLRVQTGTPFERHGAAYGPGIYTSNEPRTAWGYANPTAEKDMWKNSSFKRTTKVLLACELAGELPASSWTGIYVITDATRLMVRYVFLTDENATMPWAKDVAIPLGSVFQSMRNKTL